MMGAYFKNSSNMALLFADRPNYLRSSATTPSVTSVKYLTKTATGPRTNNGTSEYGFTFNLDRGFSYDVKYIEWTATIPLPYYPQNDVIPVFRFKEEAPYHFKYYGGAAITEWSMLHNVVTVKGVFCIWLWQQANLVFDGVDNVIGTADDNYLNHVSNMMDLDASPAWYQAHYDAMTEANIKQYLEVAVYSEYSDSMRYEPLDDVGIRIMSEAYSGSYQRPYFDSRTDKSLMRVGSISDFSNGPQTIDLDNINYMPVPRTVSGVRLENDWVHHTIGTFYTRHYDPVWRYSITLYHRNVLGWTLYETHKNKYVGSIALATVLAGSHWGAGITFPLDVFTYVNQSETKSGFYAGLSGITGIQFTGSGGNTVMTSGWPINSNIGGASSYTYYFRE